MEENFVILNMDQERELKWTFAAIKSFEKRGREILKRLDIRNDKGQPVANIPTHAGYILANFMRISDLLEAAVAASTGLSGLEGNKGEPSEASKAIEAYLASGGDLESLQQAVYKAYLMSADPSGIGAWQDQIAKEREAVRINQEKIAARIEIALLELALDQAKITSMKASGNQLSESHISS